MCDKYGYYKDSEVRGRYLSEGTFHIDSKVEGIYWTSNGARFVYVSSIHIFRQMAGI